MTKLRKDKAYKEAVKKLTATVTALGNGSWQGAPTQVICPTPTIPQTAAPKRKR